jgi:Mrp family chromosome partitioning ATPase
MNSNLLSTRRATRTGWLRTIEQIALACIRENRIIGVTAPHSVAGVSTLSHAFAELVGSWGVKTLLMDLTASKLAMTRGWTPGIGNPKDFIEQGENGYDVIRVVGLAPSPVAAFNLFRELEEYRSIVLDLPAVLEYSAYTISPIIGAVSCDTVIIVCSRGGTSFDQLKKIIEVLQVGGAKIGGTVLNEFGPSEIRLRSKYREREQNDT